MNFNNLTGFALVGAITAAVAAGWQQLRSIYFYLQSFLISSCELDYNYFANAMQEELSSWRPIRLKSTAYSVTHTLIPGHRVVRKVVSKLDDYSFTDPSGFTLFYRSGVFLWVEIRYNSRISLKWLRGTWNVEQWLQGWEDRIRQEEQEMMSPRRSCQSTQIILCVGSAGSLPSVSGLQAGDPSSATYSSPPAAFSTDNFQLFAGFGRSLSGPSLFEISRQANKENEGKEDTRLTSFVLSDVHHELFREAEIWANSRSWFYRRAIPWKRTWLLHGEPGVGKTSFVRLLARSLGLHVVSFDLSSMTNADFNKYWQRHRAMGDPTLIVFEDIDRVFEGSRNISKVGSLSLDIVLNSMSGIEEMDGQLLVLTANNIEKLDPAIYRGDRVDRVAYIPLVPLESCRPIAERMLHGYPLAISQVFQEFQEQGCTEIAPAKFYERCVTEGLKLAWQLQHGEGGLPLSTEILGKFASSEA